MTRAGYAGRRLIVAQKSTAASTTRPDPMAIHSGRSFMNEG